MALILETGHNISNSNSYVTVAEADAYHLLFGNTAWTGLTDTSRKELMLIRATDSVDLLFGDLYQSAPANAVQSLLFPRLSFYKNTWQVVNSTTIPDELKTAVYEMALLALKGVNIYPNESTDNNVKLREEQLDTMKLRTDYFKAQNVEMYPNMGKIEKYLRPILISKSTASTGYYSL